MSSGDPETRKRILDSTLHLMEKSKGRGVRVDDVARAAGVSRQAVYLHFGSRADLLVAAVRYYDELHNLEQRVRQFAGAPQGVEVLRGFIGFWGNYVPETYGLAKALMEARDVDRAARAAWDDRMNILYEGCRATIECLVRDGTLVPLWDPDRAAEILWAMLSISVWENLTVECGWTKDQYITRMQSIVERILLK